MNAALKPQYENWRVWGHDSAVEFLRRSILNQRNRHAYLITGASHIGKNDLAHAFAGALNCTHEDLQLRPCGACRSCRLLKSGNHPDMVYAQLDNNILKIDAVRDVIRLLSLKPFDSRYRITILHDFDKARPQAQDALLKTLEEPSRHAVLILLAQSTENVLPTIISRSQVLQLRPVPSETIKAFLTVHGAEEGRATDLARLSAGRIGWALSALQNETILTERSDMLAMLHKAIQGSRAERFSIAEELEKISKKEDKQAVEDLLETWQSYWRDVLLLAQNSPIKPCNADRLSEIQALVKSITADEALKALKSTRTMLTKTLKTNASVRMAFEVMFLDYPHLR